MRQLNRLLDLRNELVDEEDRIEIYDLMDAFDTEEQAEEALRNEIKSLQKA